jgi:hypothetical protein
MWRCIIRCVENARKTASHKKRKETPMSNDLTSRLKTFGFYEWNSGGEMNVLRRNLPHDQYVLVTDVNSGEVPQVDGDLLAVYYEQDGEHFGEQFGVSLDEVLRYIIERLEQFHIG